MASPSTSLRSSTRGLVLIELLVVIALMAGLLGLGLLMSMDVFHGTTYRSTRQTLVSALTLARSRALANDYQSSYGVCYDAPHTAFVVFQGPKYLTASTANDVFATDPGLTLSSTVSFTCTNNTANGVIFSQIAGTTTVATTTLTEPGHPSGTVVVNSEGTIVW